jgi:hypothetical protein
MDRFHTSDHQFLTYLSMSGEGDDLNAHQFEFFSGAFLAEVGQWECSIELFQSFVRHVGTDYSQGRKPRHFGQMLDTSIGHAGVAEIERPQAS